jgi:hypothetical protein
MVAFSALTLSKYWLAEITECGQFPRTFDIPVAGSFLSKRQVLQMKSCTSPYWSLRAVTRQFRRRTSSHRFAGAFVAVAVGIHRVGEPHAAFEAEGAVGEGAYRAHVNDVAEKSLSMAFSM